LIRKARPVKANFGIVIPLF